MADKDIRYFERRAEAELELAQRARHPDAVKAHYHLAGFYLDRVYGGDSTEPASADLGGLVQPSA
ncbi:hypothetical protein D1610_08765 [Sphingomonas gilva]|uniref:Uncharacterized protein n=1 Tax=Sphingomonas gilva TaxID=2305907 RepID=A0A396RV38_9SPHN|nr:hypothetical protein [Sphingomonas gilva]RHW17541.1 hypothetical protein D1610_08765 [Sphingomonas gilva]